MRGVTRMQVRIPTVFMRGGTSKGLFFQDNHLPKDEKVRDRVILAVYGSPDSNRRQIDGIGGATSTTSKMAIINRSDDPDYDVVYNFGQVSIDRPIIDYKGNCGNISSAVGPYAVDQGLVKVQEPITRVRIYQKNTNKRIVADVPVKDGLFDEDGDYAIAGVPGAGAKITLHFFDPGGSVTGRLFPTGNVQDVMHIPGTGKIRFTLIDAANPLVLIPARDLGLAGTEIEKIDTGSEIKGKLEAIRSRAAVMLGLCETPEEATLSCQAVPKIAMLAPPQEYNTIDGTVLGKKDIDLVGRSMTMGTFHKAYQVTGAIPTAGAAMIEGTIVYDMVSEAARKKGLIRLGHPGGIMDVGARVEKRNNTFEFKEASIGRTARRLMEGYVFVPEKLFRK